MPDLTVKTSKCGLRLMLPGIFVLLMFPRIAVFGDVVYVKDGREIKGQATQKDDKVIIKLPDGKTVTVNKSQVLHIARSTAKNKPGDKSSTTDKTPQIGKALPKAEKKTTKKAPAKNKKPPADKKPLTDKIPTTNKAEKAPAKKPPAKKKAPPVNKTPTTKTAKKNTKNKIPPKTKTSPKSKTPQKTTPSTGHSPGMPGVIKIKGAARPESFLYMLLRRRLSGPGSRGDTIEKQIIIYRMLAHDRKRRIGEKWFSPCDFSRRRKAFVGYIEVAKKKFREAKKLEKKEDTGSKKKRKGLLAAGRRYLAQASKSWADPVLRKFLLGITRLYEGNDSGAESYFRECVSQIPHVAAFHQARAKALLNLKRNDDALRENIILLKLMPSSRDALGILQLAMKKVSGSTLQGQVYKDSRAIVGKYISPPPYKPPKNSTTWLFPGKKVRSNSMLLPVLPFDRIELRQGIGVPVSNNVLAVDIGVVSGAQEVFLRVGSQIIPGRVDPHSLRPGNFVAFVYFYECKFTPIKLLAADQFKPKLQGIAYTTNIFREMGGNLRAFPVTITKVAGKNVTLSAGVAPGAGGGPVIDTKGQLLGFLTGKIDPEEEKFPERFYSVLQLGDAVEKIAKRKSKPPWRGKRNVELITIPDKTFLIEALSYESFHEDGN